MEKLKPFERRIELLKLLQGKEMRTGELAEYFGVDERTIRDDVDALRVGMKVLGVNIKIDSKHEGSQKHYYKSTVHPIFLALNASQLYLLLKLLENAMLQPRGEVYEHIFHQVYSQITDYAEELVADKLKIRYEKSEVSNLLEEEAIKRKSFILVYSEKSGRFIPVRYRDENGVIVDKEVTFVRFLNDNDVLVRDKKGNEYPLDYNDMVIDWDAVDYK